MNEVVVIGAGLAGLRCAARLEEAGVDVVVVEAADEIGGRQRTDRIDGYQCDRGFAVVNPAYPALRRYVDVDALDLRPFRAGVLVRTEDRPDLVALADPRREPSLAASALRSGLLDPRELLALGRWVAPALGSVSRLLAGPDTTLADSLDAAGVDGPLRTQVLEPFLAGVLVESHGTSSATFTRLLVRMFALGSPGLPSRGIDTLPRVMAAGLRQAPRTGERVETIRPAHAVEWRHIVETTHTTYVADAVVVATDAPAAAALLNGRAEPVPEVRPMHGLTTWWFSTDTPPHPLAMLAVDGRRTGGRIPGPVWNCADVTAAAPTYAPIGRRLIQATTLLDRPEIAGTEADVRRHLSEIYGCDTASWDLVVRHEIPHALPAMPPPLRTRLDQRVDDGLYVCGDHRDTGSIQGALVSGQRAADAVLAYLGR